MPRHPRAAVRGGFTILELLVALTMFTVIASVAYSGFAAAATTVTWTTERIEKLEAKRFQVGRVLGQAERGEIANTTGATGRGGIFEIDVKNPKTGAGSIAKRRFIFLDESTVILKPFDETFPNQDW